MNLHHALGMYSGVQPTDISLASVLPVTGITEASRSIARLHAHVGICLGQIRLNATKIIDPTVGTVTLKPEHFPALAVQAVVASHMGWLQHLHVPAPQPLGYVQQLRPDATSNAHTLINSYGNSSNAHSTEYLSLIHI